MIDTDEKWADFLAPLIARFVKHRGTINNDTIGAIVRLALQQQPGPSSRPGLEEMAEAAQAFPASDVRAIRDFFHGRCPP